MGKDELITGSVLEFKLPLELGYAYCKIFDFRYIREFDGVLAKVYDFIIKEPVKDIIILKEKEWLFGARRMPWLPNTRGKGAWKFKGVLVAEEDNIIPDFKYSNQSAPFIEDESSIKDWYAIKNIKESSNQPCFYKQVKHLEDTVLTTQNGIVIRTAMEYCRMNGLDIKEYFDLDQTLNLMTYRRMINVPVYKSIPKEIRGKALC